MVELLLLSRRKVGGVGGKEQIKDDCWVTGSDTLRYDAVATEAATSFETSTRFYKTVLRRLPEYCNFDIATRNSNLTCVHLASACPSACHSLTIADIMKYRIGEVHSHWSEGRDSAD